ncbi:MAG: GGDEF domain-containing protein [Solirubrobacteraceae bacterium]|nr:GGDEF domain-containing protein [Solirubrobacteraceae bacterium]
MSRREIALSPLVWLAVSASFAIFCVLCGGIAVLAPVDRPVLLGAFSVLLGVIAIVLARQPAPEPDAALTHGVIVLAYVGTTSAMVCLAPYTVAALPVTIFVGALSAVWLDRISQIVIHWTIATVLLLAVSIVGPGNEISLIATLTLVPPTWALGLIILWVLTTAEDQSNRLELLAKRDALTGVGNRRLLDERLEADIVRHRALRRPLTVLALDLNGFKGINDTYGHAAGDRLLIHVGATLVRVVGDRATVIRQGGDEFCVLLPETGPREAAAVVDAIRAALAPVVRTGVGVATFPADASDPDRLIDIADARLTAEKTERRGLAPVPVVDPAALDAAPSAGEAAGGRVRSQRWMTGPSDASRRTLGGSTLVWWTTGAMFVFYAVGGTLVLLFRPGLVGAGYEPVLAFGSLVAVWICVSKSPPIHTVRSEFVLAMTYVIPAALIYVSGEHASVAIGTAVFVGPLVATRTESRVRAGVHLALATVLLPLAGLLGHAGLGPMLAILLLLCSMAVLAICCVFILEAAELQGVELARLAVTDPLTGLANRRGLEESIAELLAAAPPTVAVLALDLNGFKALNDALGHGAGDLLLGDVAQALRQTVGTNALIARPGGDEFTVVLPNRTLYDAGALENDIRGAIAELSREHYPISTGIGVATFPTDGRHASTLIDAADRRLLDDKYGRRDRRKPDDADAANLRARAS